jgi:hypothetical protein
MVESTWDSHPVILLGKSFTYEPTSRSLRKTLADYRILPAPSFIEVDSRPDVDTLVPVLSRLFGVENSLDAFPLLLIGGKIVKAPLVSRGYLPFGF